MASGYPLYEGWLCCGCHKIEQIVHILFQHEGLPFPNPQPHQPHLRRSYSESGGKSGTTLPGTSIYSNQPYVYDPEDDMFQPNTTPPNSSSYTPTHGTEPYMLRSAFINTQHCSILTGASNYAVPLDSN